MYSDAIKPSQFNHEKKPKNISKNRKVWRPAIEEKMKSLIDKIDSIQFNDPDPKTLDSSEPNGAENLSSARKISSQRKMLSSNVSIFPYPNHPIVKCWQAKGQKKP